MFFFGGGKNHVEGCFVGWKIAKVFQMSNVEILIFAYVMFDFFSMEDEKLGDFSLCEGDFIS